MYFQLLLLVHKKNCQSQRMIVIKSNRDVSNMIGKYMYIHVWFKFMVFNTTVNNISDISWRLVLLVEETRKPLG
jgi:hypothetical protein